MTLSYNVNYLLKMQLLLPSPTLVLDAWFVKKQKQSKAKQTDQYSPLPHFLPYQEETGQKERPAELCMCAAPCVFHCSEHRGGRKGCPRSPRGKRLIPQVQNCLCRWSHRGLKGDYRLRTKGATDVLPHPWEQERLRHFVRATATTGMEMVTTVEKYKKASPK